MADRPTFSSRPRSPLTPPPPMSAAPGTAMPPRGQYDYAQPAIVQQSQVLAEILRQVQARQGVRPPPLPQRRRAKPTAPPPTPAATLVVAPLSPPLAILPSIEPRPVSPPVVSEARLNAVALARLLRPERLRGQMLFNQAIQPPLALRENADDAPI